ncbi:50S ribosomal protein L13 [Leptospira borgpetersenii]|nr:50S ribosomal protein L13 [Leptospira borgpetersenii]EMO62830.1 ribosomal protein L13 [Leptospira borgpetersenii serovar Pomona str. 200901868]AXX14791.1 50S ribosomal protein L13 [Leptospira borgpetersenii serovar Ceylonica]EKP15708.1 ribosomal protein L13 [Leptospira borgpetersenii str. 200801926]EKQ90587.1 ribosomal protein L13 [Leptospira borgpetersenii str. UI 09149]EMN57589.1 ribosomal protein L13 [Leptospira borgpetersenii serovar Javanica str. MK146]
MSVVSKAHRTPSLTKENAAVKSWFVVDAEGKTLGRLASGIAARLRGKHKATFTPNQDCGDNIIVINASKVKVTGNKETQKMYYHHSRYPGGMTETVFKDLIAKQPEKVIYEAVKGMLPKSKLGDKMLTHCKIFSGAEHNLQAQKPVKLEI